MKKILYILPFLLIACDDGDIQEHYTYQQEGLKVAVDAQIVGVDSWPDEFLVTLSGFKEQTNNKEIAEYAEISKQIIPPKDNSLHITLGGIPQTVNFIEITVLNRIRQRVVTLWQTPLSINNKNNNDTIKFDAGIIDVTMFRYIQTEYFNKKCVNCHGLGEGGAAAGLFLTEDKSYAALVGKPSKNRSSINFVTPGDTASSSLHKILWGNFPEVHHNHKDQLATDLDKHIIDSWILYNAKLN